MGFDFGTNLAVLLFKRKIYYYSVPLYLSYNPNKSISFFITTRFINNFDSFNPKYNTEINKLENKQNKFAITYGILFGKKNKYGIEISNNSNNLFLPTQLSLGYNIKL